MKGMTLALATTLKMLRRSSKCRGWNLIGSALHGMAICDLIKRDGVITIFEEIVGSTFQSQRIESTCATLIGSCLRERAKVWLFLYQRVKGAIQREPPKSTI